MGLFSKKPKDISVPANRKIDLNPSRKYLEWNDARILWEDEYQVMRIKHGWKAIDGHGFREDGKERFAPVLWNVNGIGVKASFDSYRGIVTEEVL